MHCQTLPKSGGGNEEMRRVLQSDEDWFSIMSTLYGILKEDESVIVSILACCGRMIPDIPTKEGMRLFTEIIQDHGKNERIIALSLGGLRAMVKIKNTTFSLSPLVYKTLLELRTGRQYPVTVTVHLLEIMGATIYDPKQFDENPVFSIIQTVLKVNGKTNVDLASLAMDVLIPVVEKQCSSQSTNFADRLQNWKKPVNETNGWNCVCNGLKSIEQLGRRFASCFSY